MRRLSLIVVLIFLPTLACEEPDDQSPPATEGYTLEVGEAVLCEAPIPTGQPLAYTETSLEAGLAYGAATPLWDEAQNGYSSVDIEFNGGIGAADLNGDSTLDLLFIDHNAPPRVFLGNGSGSFNEISATELGIESNGAYLIGASVADITGDGHPDLYLLANGHNLLFVNDGNGYFSEQGSDYGLAGPQSRSTSAAWADPDQDGDLDVLVVNHGRGSFYPGDNYPPQADQLYLRGDLVFEDRIDLLYPDPQQDGYGFTAGWLDADRDGLLDVYVVNDLATPGSDVPPNFFARNTTETESSGPTFEVPMQSYLERHMLGMGLAVGDMDTDGDLDLHVSNAGRTFLARNEGELHYIDDSLALAELSDSPRGDISWSTEFIDYDNDGSLELFCAFGHMPSKAGRGPNNTENLTEQHDALWSRGAQGTFVDLAAQIGIDSALATRTVVAADLDGNGFLDLVTWALYEGPRLYRSDCNENTWLTVELDLPGTLNRNAIGSRIEAWADDKLVALREMVAGSTGGLSSGPPQVHLGLGQHEVVDVRIQWPQGEQSIHSQIPTRRQIRIVREEP